MVQRVRNLTTASQITAEAQVQFLARRGRLKGLIVLPLAARVAAVAQIQSLAWEIPCAEGAAVKKKKKNPLKIFKNCAAATSCL